MFSILLYCFGIMYTPGPVNILSIGSGAQKDPRRHVPFCLGVSTALFFWFLLIGYAGSTVVSDSTMPVISALGAGFILYLAYKIFSSDVSVSADEDEEVALLTFRDGLFMQLLNPKSFLAVLPVTVVQFPAADITGGLIALWSALLSILGFGAPLTYAFMGSFLAKGMGSRINFKYFNVIMAVMLVLVALDMAYKYVYPSLF